MKKRLSMLGIIGASFAMAIAVGASLMHKGEVREAKAAEVAFYTLDGTITGGNNNYASASNIEQGSVTWAVFGNTLQNPWRIGGKSLNEVDRTVTSSSAFSETVTKVELTVGTASSVTVNSLKLQTSKEANFSSIYDERSVSFGTNRTLTFSPSSQKEWTSCYYRVVFNLTISADSNKFLEFKSLSLYKESSAVLQSLTLSPSSVSGYIAGTTFNKNTFLAAGVTATANYDSGDPVNVTNNVEVTSKVLEDGPNDVTISYGGKNATLVVNARTQEAIDTEAAEEVIDLIDLVDTSKSGSLLVNPIRNAATAYNALNANAKSKVSNYSDLESAINGASNYILFLNEASSDASAKIMEKDAVSPNPVPTTWHVPSTVSITYGLSLSEGAGSSAKMGTSYVDGAINISVVDSTYVFKKVQIGAKAYGSDGATVSINSNNSYSFVPGDNFADSTLFDVSASKYTSITIGNSTMRSYLSYIYFELEQNVDTLDSTIAYTGDLDKDTYLEGQSFDPTGLTFSVSYNSGATSKEIAANSITWSPAVLTTETTAVTGTYIEGEQSATCSINVTVNAYVASSYGQVGQEKADYSGTYYFYNSDTQKVWDASRSSELYSSMDATVANNIITSTANLDVCKVVLAKVDGGYSLANASGDYIGPKDGSISTVVDAVTFEAANVHKLEKVDNDGTITLSATQMNGETPTKVYLRFNSANNQLKARYYVSIEAVKGFTMFLKDGSATKTNVQIVDEFVEGYMHTEIAYTNNEDTNACRAEGEGAENYYALAKAAFNELSDEQRELFVTGKQYEKPYARLLAWATANHQAFDETNTLGARINTLKLGGESNSVILIIVLSSVAVISLGFVIAFKKKKHN